MELIDRLSSEGSTDDMLSAELRLAGTECSVEAKLCQLRFDNKTLVGMIVCGATQPHSGDSAGTLRCDPLTGLPDREFLMRRLAARLHGARSADRQFAVLFLDFDNFKQVNDQFGHMIGDNVLREAARRIAHCVREGDQVARFGGDEFVVVVENVARTDDVEPVINRIQAAMAKPIALPKGEVTLTLSVGMAMATAEHGTPEELVAAADRAMYAAKRSRA